jgi:thiol-disulfide isomerase/thioredoxin
MLVLSILVVAWQSSFAQDAVFDPESIKGDYDASITVLRQDGTSAAGERYVLQLNVSGPDPEITSGTIGSNGVIQLKGYAGGTDGPTYLLLVGKYNLEADRFQLDGESKHQKLEFVMAPGIGDIAPDIPIQHLYTKEMKHLSDYRGQMVFLDFWASWCGPCHEPMDENERAMRTYGKAWKDKVSIVALSIDDTPVEAVEFVKAKDLNSLDHYWSSEGEAGFFSDAMRVYGIDSIPTAFLIDPDGKIVWRGNPNDIDVAKRIDRTLQRARK